VGTKEEKDFLYGLDLSHVVWVRPGEDKGNTEIEIAYLPDGAGVAMRSALDPGHTLRYTPAEWKAFVLGARDGEFDLIEPGQGGPAGLRGAGGTESS
jgi:hypothetical protein